jgi:AmiR/NasT family two-component response regulator
VEIVAAALAAVLEATGERASLRALVQHMERALDSRATIEQAKGVVMAHHGGTPDEAFARLVAYSSRHNIKLRELAALIVGSGGRGAVRAL